MIVKKLALRKKIKLSLQHLPIMQVTKNINNIINFKIYYVINPNFKMYNIQYT